MIDLQAIETKVRKVDEELKKGGLRRNWAKLRWSASAEQWLKKFFIRVQLYQTEFSLELMTLQM